MRRRKIGFIETFENLNWANIVVVSIDFSHSRTQCFAICGWKSYLKQSVRAPLRTSIRLLFSYSRKSFSQYIFSLDFLTVCFLLKFSLFVSLGLSPVACCMSMRCMLFFASANFRQNAMIIFFQLFLYGFYYICTIQSQFVCFSCSLCAFRFDVSMCICLKWWWVCSLLLLLLFIIIIVWRTPKRHTRKIAINWDARVRARAQRNDKERHCNDTMAQSTSSQCHTQYFYSTKLEWILHNYRNGFSQIYLSNEVAVGYFYFPLGGDGSHLHIKFIALYDRAVNHVQCLTHT